ncbi:mitochondrial carrier domain-containing protein [Dipodascopsis tothii]|uniref:mitochondrial carrier domain-containing protein n=1 Tax=Dipodascopsis tothii TaxID=44089 RepID=UPI0034CDDE9F
MADEKAATDIPESLTEIGSSSKRYAGFAAGILSGVTKLIVGHPFDTIKVRLQTASTSQFKGPLDCLLKTVRNEGPFALYKGATPPLVGWMAMDSVMLGSLHNYRMLIKDHVFPDRERLPVIGHSLAGLGAGCTVSFVAAPIEQVKARLQIQYDAATRRYTGPINCAVSLVRESGLRGLYRGLLATMIFRSSFFFLWGSYDVLTRTMRERTALSEAAINFWAGGLSAQLFWTLAYPADVIKQTIMIDDVRNPRFKSWLDAARTIYVERGTRGFFRGFVPTAIRALPTNASALVVYEAVIRTIG